MELGREFLKWFREVTTVIPMARQPEPVRATPSLKVCVMWATLSRISRSYEASYQRTPCYVSNPIRELHVKWATLLSNSMSSEPPYQASQCHVSHLIKQLHVMWASLSRKPMPCERAYHGKKTTKKSSSSKDTTLRCGPDQPRIQTEMLGHLLIHLLVRSHCSLACLLTRSAVLTCLLAHFTYSLACGTVND